MKKKHFNKNDWIIETVTEHTNVSHDYNSHNHVPNIEFDILPPLRV